MSHPVLLVETTHPAIVRPSDRAPLTARVPIEAVEEFAGPSDGISEHASVGALAAARARKNGYQPMSLEHIQYDPDREVYEVEMEVVSSNV